MFNLQSTEDIFKQKIIDYVLKNGCENISFLSSFFEHIGIHIDLEPDNGEAFLTDPQQFRIAVEDKINSFGYHETFKGTYLEAWNHVFYVAYRIYTERRHE